MTNIDLIGDYRFQSSIFKDSVVKIQDGVGAPAGNKMKYSKFYFLDFRFR